jgi:glycosyltransferase involved in cell wall biosynthesis
VTAVSRPELSVVLCSHNPKPEYLGRAIDALRQQTLDTGHWEFLLIDNRSESPLAPRFDLSWHQHACHVREENLGLTNARLRGIRESRGEVLAFIDDDNVVAPDFLVRVEEVARTHPYVGAWNGQIHPAFEEPPPAWSKPYWGWLAIREFAKDRWANFPTDEIVPYGAGLCVRRVVAERYATTVPADPVRLELGRKGTSLSGCEDADIAFTACDLGLGIGLFASIRLSHIIPPSRLRAEYLARIMEGSNYSGTMLKLARGLPVWREPRSLPSRVMQAVRLWRLSQADRSITRAGIRGRQRALADWAPIRQVRNGSNA